MFFPDQRWEEGIRMEIFPQTGKQRLEWDKISPRPPSSLRIESHPCSHFPSSLGTGIFPQCWARLRLGRGFLAPLTSLFPLSPFTELMAVPQDTLPSPLIHLFWIHHKKFSSINISPTFISPIDFAHGKFPSKLTQEGTINYLHLSKSQTPTFLGQ